MPLMFHDDPAFSRQTLRAVNHIADGGADLGKAVSTAFRIKQNDLDSSHRDRTEIANQVRPVADNAKPARAWTPARLSVLELSGLTSGATVTLLSREMV